MVVGDGIADGFEGESSSVDTVALIGDGSSDETLSTIWSCVSSWVGGDSLGSSTVTGSWWDSGGSGSGSGSGTGVGAGCCGSAGGSGSAGGCGLLGTASFSGSSGLGDSGVLWAVV